MKTLKSLSPFLFIAAMFSLFSVLNAQKELHLLRTAPAETFFFVDYPPRGWTVFKNGDAWQWMSPTGAVSKFTEHSERGAIYAAWSDAMHEFKTSQRPTP